MTDLNLLNFLVAHAVGQFGYDRLYKIRFGASTPTISVYEDTQEMPLISEFWLVNGVIQQKKFY